MADSVFKIRNGGANVYLTGIQVLGKFEILTCGEFFLHKREHLGGVYLSWQRIHKQCERCRNGVTQDQMVQMKQNANTLVTQLQYFHMHMLQICLARTTTVFIQCHILEGIKFLFWHKSQQSFTLPPRREIWTWDNVG